MKNKTINLLILSIFCISYFSCEYKRDDLKISPPTEITKTLTPIKLITNNNQIFNYDSIVFSWEKQHSKGYEESKFSYKIIYEKNTPLNKELVNNLSFSDTIYNATSQLKAGGDFYWQLVLYYDNKVTASSDINKITVTPKDTIKFTKFSLVDENGNSIKANINYNTKEITFHEFGNDTLISRLNIAEFETNRTTFTTKVKGVDQISGTTENWFSKGDIIYEISDGENTEIYVVKQIRNKLGYDPFVFEIKTTADNEFKIPLQLGAHSFVVDWGDGSPISTVNSHTDANATHVFPNNTTKYRVKISGTIKGFSFNGHSDAELMSEILQWGTLNLGNTSAHFSNCENLTKISSKDTLDLTGTTNFAQMFFDCEKLKEISGIENWYMNNATNMKEMFKNARVFNGNLSQWNVNNVTTMDQMFLGAENFSSNLGNWNVSSVTNMRFMFYNAKKFNGKLNGWGQNVQNVTDMERMFSGATSFNQEIGAWNVSSVTNMTHIFDGATLFNQGLNNWEVNNVTDMQAMFRKTSFNKPLNNWANRLGNVINIANMFQHNNNFLQDITTWDVGHVTNCAFFNNPSSLKDDKAPSNLRPTCKGNP